MNGPLTIWLLLFGCILLCAAACAVTYRLAQKKTRRILIRVQQQLDQAIAGNLQEEIYDESLNGAILERLNQLVAMAGMQRDQAARERDDVMALISNITHQIRTPIASLMLYGGMLQEQTRNTPQASLAEKILGQAEKIEFFMKELIRASYAEQEMLKMQPEQTDAREMAAAACQNAELSAMRKGICIQSLPLQKGSRKEPLYCLADRRWTLEALDNVLDNAIKYGPEHSLITLRILEYESFLCFEIRDQGPGIPEEEQARIFTRFYRSPSARNTPGFGIGLYLVREILRREGGYVQVKSKPNEGAAFRLYLPRNLSNLSHLKKI